MLSKVPLRLRPFQKQFRGPSCRLFFFQYKQMYDEVLWVNILFVAQNTFFLLAAFRDPGYEPKDKINFLKLVEKYSDPSNFCPNCETVCRPDLLHCYICARCVDHFDHHCNWINNCVGKGNHKFFYFYIVLLLIYFIILYIKLLLFINIDFETEVDLTKGSTQNLMGFGEYGEADQLTGIKSIFNVNRYYWID